MGETCGRLDNGCSVSDLNAATLQQGTLGEIQVDQGDAVVDDRLDFGDLTGREVPLGLGDQQGGAGPYLETLLFGRQSFFLQAAGGGAGRYLLWAASSSLAARRTSRRTRCFKLSMANCARRSKPIRLCPRSLPRCMGSVIVMLSTSWGFEPMPDLSCSDFSRSPKPV